MRMNRSALEYPEHLNPFDDKYDGVPEECACESSRHRYNTWSGKRGLQVNGTLDRPKDKVKEKPTFLEKPWDVLHVGGKGKLVRRLSFLKTAVERVSFRRKRQQEPLARSNSLHADMSYRITSPKVKERLRLQALPALAKLEQAEVPENSANVPSSPQQNGRLVSSTPLRDEDEQTPTKDNDYSVDSPETTDPHYHSATSTPGPAVRPMRRKKRPPPPPPPVAAKTVELMNGSHSGRAEDSVSASSSITQDLERALLTADNDSLAEFEFDREKLELHSTI